MFANIRERVLRDSASGIVTIDLDALAFNYVALAATAAPARCAAVVKADAYGLGVVPVARTLLPAGCRDFFVAHLGHGTLGWTMACGSAAIIADLVSNRAPGISSDDLALSRYGS